MVIGAVFAGLAGVMYPLLLAAIGIIASILGTFFVRVKERRNPAKALRYGLGSTGLFMIIRNILPHPLGLCGRSDPVLCGRIRVVFRYTYRSRNRILYIGRLCQR